jgi:hypothetical protein
MAASLDDILTTQRNGVIAANNIAQTYLNVQGIVAANALTTTTLVSAGTGRLASVSVLVAGAVGKIYDAANSSLTTNQIYVIPAVVGVYVVNWPIVNGIVVAPGAGQTVSVSYS